MLHDLAYGQLGTEKDGDKEKGCQKRACSAAEGY